MIDWTAVAEDAKLTTQTIRSMLDHHGIGYWLENAPIRKQEDKGGCYIFTRCFGVEILAHGEAIYALENERPDGLDGRPFHEPFVQAWSWRDH